MLPPPPRSTLFPYTTLFRSFPGGSGAETVSLEPVRLSLGEPRVQPARGDAISTSKGVRLSRYVPSQDRKSTRLNSSHTVISYAVFCLKKKKKKKTII